MASLRKKVKENADGTFFVDSTCIDCGSCRWIAPDIFAAADGHSYVIRQPALREEELKNALRALHSCPTASIGAMQNAGSADASELFPNRIEDNVYHCGYHSKKSFGAASYIIIREEGNVMIDSPRFVKSLMKRIEEMGGLKYLFLTHKDDVADHKKFAKRLNAKRIIHNDDAEGELREVEMIIEGYDPVELDNDLTIIPVPGHTRGSICLLFFFLLAKIDADKAALNTVIAPMISLWLGSTLNGETLEPQFIWGAALIITGLVIYQYGHIGWDRAGGSRISGRSDKEVV